jgi:hypothetical protein
MPSPFMAARYHSLSVAPETLPPDVIVTARTEEDYVVMGIRHLNAPVEGVQFHPESVLTPEGPHLLANFLRLAGEGEAALLDQVSGSFALTGLGGDHGAAQPSGAAAAERGAAGQPRPAEPASVGAPTRTAKAIEAAVAGRVEIVR